MKKLFFMMLVWFVSSCNQDVALNAEPKVTLTPDYNLLTEGQPYLAQDLRSNKYRASIAIYLRAFANVSKQDTVTLQFASNQPASYTFADDIFYNGDKVNVQYGDFKNYLMELVYVTENRGKHTVTISATIRSVTKTTTVNMER